MNPPQDDIHPLDQDYSSPISTTGKRRRSLDEKVRRFGIAVFAGGFVLVFLAAIVLSVWNGVERIERFGSFLHRFAMLTILCGGIAVMTSYRLSLLQKRRKQNRQARRRLPIVGFLYLIAINVILLLIFLASTFFMPLIPREAMYFVFNTIFSVIFSLAVTMIVWHRGMLRAFGIGVLVALIFNAFGVLMNFSGGYFLGRQFGGFVAHLAIIQVSGLFCAGYVSYLTARSSMDDPLPCKEGDRDTSQ